MTVLKSKYIHQPCMMTNEGVTMDITEKDFVVLHSNCLK